MIGQYRTRYDVSYDIKAVHPLTHEVTKKYPDRVHLIVEMIVDEDHKRVHTIPVYSEVLK